MFLLPFLVGRLCFTTGTMLLQAEEHTESSRVTDTTETVSDVFSGAIGVGRASLDTESVKDKYA